MSLVCQPPTPLDTALITKYLSDKVYPKMLTWGKSTDTKAGSRLGWVETMMALKHSWVGQDLIGRGWNLELDQTEWAQIQNGGPIQAHSAPPPGFPYQGQVTGSQPINSGQWS
jgi:hypothetical protein